MKVKTFTGSETAKVDKRVNDWLAGLGIDRSADTAMGSSLSRRRISARASR